MSYTKATNGHELILTRTFEASRARVFQAFTDPLHLAQWWGPHGFSTPTCRADAWPGGELYLEMRGPEGSPWETPYPMYGSYVEVVEPEKVVFRARLKNADGSTYLETLNTITLTEAIGKTTLNLYVTVAVAAAGSEGPLSGMAEGWKQSLERLGEHVQIS